MAMELTGKISFDERGHAYLYDAVILHNTDRALWRNFSGGPTRFDKVGGKRFFTVLLSPEQARELAARGWKVQTYQPKDENGNPDPTKEPISRLEVTVNLKGKVPPDIQTSTNGNRVNLTEATIKSLDSARIAKASLMLNPYHWENNRGEHGVAAYLLQGLFFIAPSFLDEQYNNFMAENDESINEPLPFND